MALRQWFVSNFIPALTELLTFRPDRLWLVVKPPALTAARTWRPVRLWLVVRPPALTPARTLRPEVVMDFIFVVPFISPSLSMRGRNAAHVPARLTGEAREFLRVSSSR